MHFEDRRQLVVSEPIGIVAESQPIEKQVYFGYLDFSRLHTLHQAGAYFVIRARKDLRFVRLGVPPGTSRPPATTTRTARPTSRCGGPATASGTSSIQF